MQPRFDPPASSRLGRARIGVYADLAEVMAESRLHEPARGRIQRLARRTHYLVNDGRDSSLSWPFAPKRGRRLSTGGADELEAGGIWLAGPACSPDCPECTRLEQVKLC